MMNEPPAFDLAAALDSWRGELSLRDVLSPSNQSELNARLTTIVQDSVRQGHSEAEAFARAKDEVGGDHGDALGALWRLRRLAKWEAARWALVGVAVLSCFQLLNDVVMCCVIFSWNLKGDESFTNLLPLINRAGTVSRIGTALILAGFGYHAIVHNSKLFRAWWHCLSRRLTVLVVIMAMLHSVVGLAQQFAWQPSILSNISHISYEGLISVIFRPLISSMVLVLLSGIVQWRIRALQLPDQLGGTLHNRAAWPTQKQWQWVLAGIMSLSLMSTVVGTGATFLQNSIKFYGIWTSDLLRAFLMLSVWALAWFVVDLPTVQAIGQWLLKRPWRLLACGALLWVSFILLSEYFLNRTFRWDRFYAYVIYLPLQLVVPVVLILWMKCAARRDAGG
jgi:hypothetical protein